MDSRTRILVSCCPSLGPSGLPADCFATGSMARRARVITSMASFKESLPPLRRITLRPCVEPLLNCGGPNTRLVSRPCPEQSCGRNCMRSVLRLPRSTHHFSLLMHLQIVGQRMCDPRNLQIVQSLLTNLCYGPKSCVRRMRLLFSRSSGTCVGLRPCGKMSCQRTKTSCELVPWVPLTISVEVCGSPNTPTVM